MTTIYQLVVSIVTQQQTKRLQELKRIGAPAVVIQTVEATIQNPARIIKLDKETGAKLVVGIERRKTCVLITIEDNPNKAAIVFEQGKYRVKWPTNYQLERMK